MDKNACLGDGYRIVAWQSSHAKHRRWILSECVRFGFRAHEDPDPVGALLGWLLGNIQEEATSGAITS